MPSGPDTFVADPRYRSEFEKARGLVLGHPRRWRVIYHYDADGIASASSALRAFGRLGYPVQATPLHGVERERIRELLRATKGPVLIADTGASWLDEYPKHADPVVVLDHHRYPGVPTPPELPDHVAFVNPLDWGVDGMSELCASMLTWLFTIFLDPMNWDNAPWGLSGAIGDRMHVGGFKGLSARLVEEAVTRSVIVERKGTALLGPTIGEALATAIDPFFRGLSGDRAKSEAFLRDLSIDPSAAPGALPPAETDRLVIALRARLESAGVLPEFVAILDQVRWYLPSLGMDAEELSNLQSATGRGKVPGVGVEMCLGDAAAFDRARALEHEWRSGILKGLLRIERDGVQTQAGVRWFESPEMTLAGTQAGMAMNYLLPPDRPVLVISPESDRPQKISGRGTLRLVRQGLDLSVALRDAAEAVGGEGGGHPVASGATIPPGTWDKFREVAGRLVAAQLKLDGAA